MRRFLTAIALGLCLGSSWPAWAQEGGALTDEEARNLYQAGEIAFEQGRFENALDYFERAYALSKRPQLLFNIGIVADRLRRDERALAAFEQYLREVPDGTEAVNVRARIGVLQRTLAEREAASAPAPVAAPAPAPAPAAQAEPRADVAPPTATDAPPRAQERGDTERSTLVPWLLAGGGAAVTVTGAILLAVGQSRRGEVEDAEVGTAWADVARYEDADTFTGLGVALLGLGVVSGVLGAVWLASDGEGEHDSSGVRVELGPRTLALRGRL